MKTKKPLQIGDIAFVRGSSCMPVRLLSNYEVTQADWDNHCAKNNITHRIPNRTKGFKHFKCNCLDQDENPTGVNVILAEIVLSSKASTPSR